VSAFGVRREKAAFSSGWKSYPATAPAGCTWNNCGGNDTVEAIGEAVTKYSDSARVQAIARMKAEQGSKRTMRRPTRISNRGTLIRLGKRAEKAPNALEGWAGRKSRWLGKKVFTADGSSWRKLAAGASKSP
jgi:hypothetical protein